MRHRRSEVIVREQLPARAAQLVERGVRFIACSSRLGPARHPPPDTDIVNPKGLPNNASIPFASSLAGEGLEATPVAGWLLIIRAAEFGRTPVEDEETQQVEDLGRRSSSEGIQRVDGRRQIRGYTRGRDEFVRVVEDASRGMHRRRSCIASGWNTSNIINFRCRSFGSGCALRK